MGIILSNLFYNFYNTTYVKAVTAESNTTISDIAISVTAESDTDESHYNKSIYNYKSIYTTENIKYPEKLLNIFNILDSGEYFYKSNILLYENKVYKIKSSKINDYTLKNLLNIFRALDYFNFQYALLPLSIYSANSSEWIEEYTYFPNEDLFHYMYEPGGGLYNTLNDTEFKITNKTYFHIITSIFKEIIIIVSELHKLNIAHLDIKPDNFLVCNDLESGNIKLKLIDFEFSCINTSKNNKCCGTTNYASYKLLKYKKVNNLFCCDIWSCTVILHMFLFNHFPWEIADDTNPNMRQYLNNYNDNYWKIQLSDINMPTKYIDSFAALFDYGFSINKNAVDINKMLEILSDIKI